MNTATPQDTYDHTIGAGALSFGWWLGCETTGVSASGDVADDWQATLTAEDGDGDPKTVVVGHAQIMSAARKIIGDDGVPYVSDTARRQCRALVFDADDADFDAGTGDELLQAAVLGEVVFG